MIKELWNRSQLLSITHQNISHRFAESSKKARGIYVDTPILNTGGRKFYEAAGYQLGYIMPRYYEEDLDGVTFQKFFERV